MGMPCQHFTAAGQEFGGFQPASQAKPKVVLSQQIKYDQAEPFHFLHMGPMSVMLQC
jgi:hypothetical protein